MGTEIPRILVVDDDVDTCRNLSDILTDLGYHVGVAHNGPEALDLIRHAHYDLALLDFKMPGMDGLTLYRNLKQLSPGTVVIIISAYLSSTTTQEARQAGTWRILSKPVDLSILLPLVDEAVRQPQIMIVDDDHDLCASLWDLLRDRGYRVCVAHSATEAGMMARDRNFRVVLLDLKLPEGNGVEVFRTVHGGNTDCRTILITAHRSELESSIHEVLEEGADAVCYKPFDLDQLLTTIKRLSSHR